MLGSEGSDPESEPEGRDLDFWESKEKKPLPWNFLLGVQQILQVFPALDVQQFKRYVITKGSDEMKDWFQRMKFSQKFNEKVQDEIIEMRTANYNTPWYFLLRNTTSDTFKALCEKTPMSLLASEQCIETILNYNEIDIRNFVWFLWNLMDKKSGKCNALHFLGEVNSGKTLLANSIARSAVYYSVLNKVGKGNVDFCYEPLLGSRVAILNECSVNDNNYEDFLSITEGERIPINVKYKAPVALDRVPLIITSNNVLWADCSSWRATIAMQAFPQRVKVLHFRSCPELSDYAGKDINPFVWLMLIDKYVKKSEVDKVYNSAPDMDEVDVNELELDSE